MASKGEKVGIKASPIYSGMVATNIRRDIGVLEAETLQPEYVAALYLVTLRPNAKFLKSIVDRKGSQ